MTLLISLLMISLSWHASLAAPSTLADLQEGAAKISVVYDSAKDKTTVSLAPVQISGPNGKYHSIHMSPSFSYPAREPRTPEFIDFELRTVVKGKLRIDLYVLFIVDGEKIFLSSSRWAVKKGNLGHGWMGEHLVFRMPYKTFLKINSASSFEIKLADVIFPVGEAQRQALRELAAQIEEPGRSDGGSPGRLMTTIFCSHVVRSNDP